MAGAFIGTELPGGLISLIGSLESLRRRSFQLLPDMAVCPLSWVKLKICQVTDVGLLQPRDNE